MRIGIDGRLSGSRHAGIGRYVESLLKRLPTAAPDIEWVYFYAEEGQLAFAETLPNVKLVQAAIKHYTLAEQWLLPPIFNQAHLDLLHVPHFNAPFSVSCPLVITVHDLLWHEFRGVQVTTLPSWLYWPKYLGYRFITTQAIAHAAAILVPAETVKKTVTRYYPQAAQKITVTPEGVSASFINQKTGNTSPKPVLVYLGSLYPHKNVKIIIEALHSLPNFTLLIVGARTVFETNIREMVTKAGIEKQVKFVGYLTDEELTTTLQTATALIQPSLSEGFGLTGVEAMATGVPVIASDIPIFKEIYQSAATFFDPHSAAALVAAVNKVSDPAIRRQVISEGKKVSSQYRWETMVEQTLAVYRQVLGIHA